MRWVRKCETCLLVEELKPRYLQTQKERFRINKMLSQKRSIIQSKFSTSKTRNLQTQINHSLSSVLSSKSAISHIHIFQHISQIIIFQTSQIKLKAEQCYPIKWISCQNFSFKNCLLLRRIKRPSEMKALHFVPVFPWFSWQLQLWDCVSQDHRTLNHVYC